MLLDFSQMPDTVIPCFYGGEKEISARMFADPANRIMYSTLVPGASIGLHTHETGSEILYILKGTGTALFDDGTEALSPGICHYCPKGHSHALINNGDEDLIFFAVVPQQ